MNHVFYVVLMLGNDKNSVARFIIMKKKIKNVIAIICIFCLLISTMSGCAARGDESMRSIVDCAGDKVFIPSEINRVICTSQNAMDFMVGMGLRDKLIGVHKSVFNHTWSPEFIDDLSSISGYGYSPAAEAVFKADADLVIVKDKSIADELRNAGIAAITFSYKNDEELFSAVTLLGNIFGYSALDYAEKWISEYKSVVLDISDKLNSIPENERLSAYYIDASGALDAGGLCTTVGGDSIIAQWLKNVGVSLVTENEESIDSINEEYVLQLNPKMIVIGGWAENTRKEQLLKDSKWANIDAVKNGNIFTIPSGFTSFDRYCVEAPLLLKYSASMFYPDIFEYDAITDFHDFFTEYLHRDISSDKIEYMLLGLSPDGSRMD